MKKITFFLAILGLANLVVQAQDTYYFTAQTVYAHDKASLPVNDSHLRAMLDNPGVEVRCKLFVVDSINYQAADFWLTRQVYASGLIGSFDGKAKNFNFQYKYWSYSEESSEIIIFIMFFLLISLITALYRNGFMRTNTLKVMWVIASTILVCALATAVHEGNLPATIWLSVVVGGGILAFALWNWVFRAMTKDGVEIDDIIGFSRIMCMVFAVLLPLAVGMLTHSWLAGLSFFLLGAIIYPIPKYLALAAYRRLEKKNKPPELVVS